MSIIKFLLVFLTWINPFWIVIIINFVARTISDIRAKTKTMIDYITIGNLTSHDTYMYRYKCILDTFSQP